VEFACLRNALGARLGSVQSPARAVLTYWLCGALAAGVVWGARWIWLQSPNAPTRIQALVLLALFAAAYGAAALALGVAEARQLVNRVLRRR
jgi:hypothetical protein